MSNLSLAHPLFVIIGPSGSGKTRVTEAVFPKEAKIITHTTRPKRPGEVDKVDYYFETKESFSNLFDRGKLVEQDTYHAHQYGVSMAEIIQRSSQRTAYTILTYAGFKKVHTYFPNDTVLIYFKVERDHLKTRLSQRENNPQLIQERLDLYEKEIKVEQVLQQYPRYYQLNANQTFEEVVADLKKIVKRES